MLHIVAVSKWYVDVIFCISNCVEYQAVQLLFDCIKSCRWYFLQLNVPLTSSGRLVGWKVYRFNCRRLLWQTVTSVTVATDLGQTSSRLSGVWEEPAAWCGRAGHRWTFRPLTAPHMLPDFCSGMWTVMTNRSVSLRRCRLPATVAKESRHRYSLMASLLTGLYTDLLAVDLMCVVVYLFRISEWELTPLF